MSVSKDFFAVGKRIAEVRGGLTQADFAARLGVDRKTVVRWEAGERLPDGASLLKLVMEFGADLNHLLTGHGDRPKPPALTAEQQQLLARYAAADEMGRKMARRVLSTDPDQTAVKPTVRRGPKAA